MTDKSKRGIPVSLKPPRRSRWRIFGRLLNGLHRLTLKVAGDFHMVVALPPPEIYRRLSTIARPSIDRLEHRNLFVSGRRYFINPRRDGDFTVTTTSKLPWGTRRRTTSTAFVVGHVVGEDGIATHLVLRGRMRLFYFAEQFLLPVFMGSLLVYTPWSRVFVAGLIALLMTLSWIAHRYTAKVEVHDILYFIERALEADEPDLPVLPAGGGDVVVDPSQKFSVAWERFIHEQADSTDE